MSKKPSQLKDYSPIFTFIAATFLFEIMHINRATATFWSLIISWLTYMAEVKILLNDARPGRKIRKEIQKRMGLLTLIAVLTFVVALSGWLHWLSGVPLLVALLLAALIYFIALFNAIHFNRSVKEKAASQ